MVIYKTTNLINNKIYIGKTINDRPEYFGSGILIKNSIDKYGIDNFKKEIIDNTSSIDELNEKEIQWIKYFNSTDLTIGYNISKGGDGGDLFTNNPNKEEIRKKYSKKGKKNGMFGRNHTDDSKEKMSEKLKNKKRSTTIWNKGLSKDDYSTEYRYNIEHQKRNFFNKSKRTYIVFSPDRKLYEVYGTLQNFCNVHDLTYTTFLYYKNKGIINESPRKSSSNREKLVGWEIRDYKYHKSINKIFISKETKEKLKEKKNTKRNKIYYLISPKNITHNVKWGLSSFCEKHNINYNVIKKHINKGKIVASNKKRNDIRTNTIGWEIKTNINIEIEQNRTYYIILSPDNKEYKLYNGVRYFCEKNNLWYRTMMNHINKGKIKYPIKSFTTERLNTTGWEIKKIDN